MILRKSGRIKMINESIKPDGNNMWYGFIMIMKPGQILARATTTDWLWCVQKSVLIWSYCFHVRATRIFHDLQSDPDCYLGHPRLSSQHGLLQESRLSVGVHLPSRQWWHILMAWIGIYMEETVGKNLHTRNKLIFTHFALSGEDDLVQSWRQDEIENWISPC